MGFDKPLTLTKLTKRRWKVEVEFSYTCQAGKVYTIPRAYVTDLASIPRLFWSIYPPDGDYSQAAVFHDYLCEKKIETHQYTHLLFLEAMESLGVRRRQANTMYRAVKWFGPRWKEI